MTEPINLAQLKQRTTEDRDYGDGYSDAELSHDTLLALIDIAEAAHQLDTNWTGPEFSTYRNAQQLRDALARIDFGNT